MLLGLNNTDSKLSVLKYKQNRKMKSITPKQITYIAAISLLLILGTQTFLVYDYYQTTRAGLVRESDAIIQEAFKKELNIRTYKHSKISSNHKNSIDTIRPPASVRSNEKVLASYNVDKMNINKDDYMSLINIAINEYTSKKIPINIKKLDSIVGGILISRGIHADYQIKLVNPITSKVIEQSKKGNNSSVFSLSSQNLRTDFENKKSLQLVLINPFGLIIKRMGLMLFASLIFSIICFLAFGYLQRILAKQKQLVAFKNDFLSTIAHELKRPVASLSFNLDCLSLPAFSEDKSKHELLVNHSINATAELNNTINMIMALTKIEEGLLTLNKEPVNLNELFEELRAKFVSYPVKKVEIQTVYESSDVSVRADANLLSQCFANLIDNAIKYSGNEVLIVINVSKSDRWIVVSIKDNGYGIPEEKLPMIFDKYNRAHTENTKINGFGIGLNYVKTIVEKHRGEVAVESQSGEGTRFSVLLPE
jgi:two-component system, OmpR family, phosphate regulon sensor histidine kinase PhoR